MQIMTEKEAENFLEKNGFPVVRRIFSNNLEETIKAAKIIKFPLVLKICSSKILHKSDVHGVKANINNFEELKNSFEELKKINNFEGVIVQEYIDGQLFIAGLKKDITFGPTLLFGLGGIFTEIIKDVSFRVCPINKKDSFDIIKELKSYKILEGIRGQKRVNLNSISEVLLKLNNLSQYYDIQELDINPLVVNEKISKIVDARIVFN